MMAVIYVTCHHREVIRKIIHFKRGFYYGINLKKRIWPSQQRLPGI